MVEEQNAADDGWKPSPEVLRAIDVLRQQFGQQYLSKIVQLSSFSFYCQLQIKKLPSSLFTPELVNGTFKINLKAPVSCLSSLVADLLNINKDSIRLFVQDQGCEQKGEIELRCEEKIYELNNKFWKNWRGVELLELKNIAKSAGEGCRPARGNSKGRIVYYIVDFSKIVM